LQEHVQISADGPLFWCQEDPEAQFWREQEAPPLPTVNHEHGAFVETKDLFNHLIIGNGPIQEDKGKEETQGGLEVSDYHLTIQHRRY
jgi:hypothetical protein